jgi:integrase
VLTLWEVTLSKPKKPRAPNAPATLLTDAGIQKRRPTNKRQEISDAGCQGLRLVIQARTGKKSFVLRFRQQDGVTASGKPRTHAKLVLGAYDPTGKELKGEPVIGQLLTLAAARALAAAKMRERALGVNVIEERRAAKSRLKSAAADRVANAFGTALIEFFTDHTTKKGQRARRWREDAATLGLRYAPGSDPKTDEPEIIRGSLADIWRDKLVASIDGHLIHGAVDQARKQNKARGRKTFAALSVFFGWLLQNRKITVNPCVGVSKPPPPPARERVLTDNEIAIFWKACDRVSVPFGALFRILLLTGVRLREAARCRRNELADGIWSIPGGRTKNGKGLSLTLPPLALQIIESVPHISDEFVFSTGKTPVSGFGKAKKALDTAMVEVAGKPVEEFRLHDLRRSFASGLASLGVALPVVERLLNHISGSFGGVAGVYQRYEFGPEKAEALQRWATHIEGLVSDRPSNVANMSDKKRGRK